MILFLDTHDELITIAVKTKDDLFIKTKISEYSHSIFTMPMIEEIFNENNLNIKDLNKIIVVNGPGSFTGIRIGLTIAKVYAWGLNIPITTIYSLEAMAISSNKNTYHVPMINARRGYVFSAIYDENYNEVLKPQHIPLTELQDKLKDIDNYEIISNDEFDEIENINSYSHDFLKIVEYFKDKECVNPHAVNPEYLKLTEAEESKK